MPTPTLDSLTSALPEEAQAILTTLHAVALANGCQFRIDSGDGKHTLVYSAMSYAVHVDGDAVTLATEYDLRAFLDFYRTTDDETAKALLFHAAAPCEYCINDKCTTLVSGANRTITLGEAEKKLCGPYRHHLRFEEITREQLPSVKAIAEMAFRYCTPAMHSNVLYENEVGYRVEEQPEFVVIGFRYQATAFGMRLESFLQECLAPSEDGRRKIDTLLEITGQPDPGRYVGVTTTFVNSACYQLVLGLVCEEGAVPAELPQGVVKLRVGKGEWAVYNSSAQDYPSIWKHFHANVYRAERKGYDTHRDPFEYFDAEGRFHDVHIPISADAPWDSGQYTRVTLTPDIQVAGIRSCNETDHPFYRDEAGMHGKLLQHFPHAERVIDVCIHSLPGQPMVHFVGVEVDKLDVVPPDLEVLTIRGGSWHVRAYPYYRPGDYVIENAGYTPRFPIDMLNHPRGFLVFDYVGRGVSDRTNTEGSDVAWGLYSEFYTPIRRVGEPVVELIEKPVCIIAGKEEAPPDSYVTEADLAAFRDLDANLTPGSCIYAFKQELHNGQWFDQKPVIKGAEVAEGTLAPEGLRLYTLPGGRYVKVTETFPNGDLDWWTGGYVFGAMKEETGYELDLERLIFIRQLDWGRSFEFYAPVK